MLTDEMRYRLLKLLKSNPELSQREVASELGVSLGKVNYCLRALVAKGLIKAVNFKNSRSKIAYVYRLTPRGLSEKARIAVSFLHRKAAEYEELRSEIEEIRKESGKPSVRKSLS
jgi:EPS-associated MarR family transcriptional regulator